MFRVDLDTGAYTQLTDEFSSLFDWLLSLGLSSESRNGMSPLFASTDGSVIIYRDYEHGFYPLSPVTDGIRNISTDADGNLLFLLDCANNTGGQQ